jgi:hypothetical protein
MSFLYFSLHILGQKSTIYILRQFSSINHAMDIPISKGGGEANSPPGGGRSFMSFN